MTYKKPKKISRKQIIIIQQELVKYERFSIYNKFQLWVAERLKLKVADAHKYLFRIQYKGQTSLKVNDVVLNAEGAVFVVLKEENRIAMLVSKDASFQKPLMYGKLTLLEKPKKQNK